MQDMTTRDPGADVYANVSMIHSRRRLWKVIFFPRQMRRSLFLDLIIIAKSRIAKNFSFSYLKILAGEPMRMRVSLLQGVPLKISKSRSRMFRQTLR